MVKALSIEFLYTTIDCSFIVLQEKTIHQHQSIFDWNVKKKMKTKHNESLSHSFLYISNRKKNLLHIFHFTE